MRCYKPGVLTLEQLEYVSKQVQPGCARVALINLAHISEADARTLELLIRQLQPDGSSDVGLIGTHGFGFFISTNAALLEDAESRITGVWGMTDNYFQLLRKLNDIGFWYVCLDQEGWEIEGLKKFDW